MTLLNIKIAAKKASLPPLKEHADPAIPHFKTDDMKITAAISALQKQYFLKTPWHIVSVACRNYR